MTALLLLLRAADLYSARVPEVAHYKSHHHLGWCRGCVEGKNRRFCPGLEVKYYMDAASKASISERSKVLDSRWQSLRAYVDSLDPTDPKTARVVILTAYITW